MHVGEAGDARRLHSRRSAKVLGSRRCRAELQVWWPLGAAGHAGQARMCTAKPMSDLIWLHASQMTPSFLPTPCDTDRRRTAYHELHTNAPRTRGSLRSPCRGIKDVCHGRKVFLAEPPWAGRSGGAFLQHPSSGQSYLGRDVAPE